MKKTVSAKLAGSILLVFLGLLFIFHILVLLQIVPADIVWGGQVENGATNLVMLETIALVTTLVFGIVIAAKTGYINPGRFKTAVNIGVWIIFGFLLLNTLGNLASGVSLENLIFAPVTLALALLALRLAVEKIS